MKKYVCGFFLIVLVASVNRFSSAQTAARKGEVDLEVGYSALHRNNITGASFWQQGGQLELSATAYRGFGAAMNISGANANNIVGTGVNLSTVTEVFGPRYTWSPHSHKLSIFGQGLVGESNGFDSVFPARGGATQSFDTLALRVGGGIDFRLGHRWGVRALQADWLRTQFPNATTNVQNSLQLGAGIFIRLR